MFALEAAGTLDASDTQRLYAREPTAGNQADAAEIDLENTPQLGLTLAWPTTALALEYAPHLFWSDVVGSEPSPTLLLHTAGLRLSARDERLHVSLAQTFAAGDRSYGQLGARAGSLEVPPTAAPAPSAGVTPSPELELLPRATVLRVLEAESSASLRYAWSRRLSTEVRPSFAITGGADAPSRRALPRQRTARVDAALDYRASARDALTTRAGVMKASISSGYDHLLVSVMQMWSRTTAPETGGALGMGLAVQQTRGPSDSPFDANGAQAQPVGLARVWHSLLSRSGQLRLQAEVGHQPHINVLTGSLQSRLYASADATGSAGDTSIRLALGAAQTLPLDEPDTARSLTADLVLEQALLDWLSAELGGQLAWQRLGQDELAVGDTFWMVFAGARAQVPSVRF